jgi:hypothetical protein
MTHSVPRQLVLPHRHQVRRRPDRRTGRPLPRPRAEEAPAGHRQGAGQRCRSPPARWTCWRRRAWAARCSPTWTRTRTRGTWRRGLAVYRAGGHDGVICFGGGSALDLGKMIALMAHQGQTLSGLGPGGYRRLVDPRRCPQDRAHRRGADHGRHRVGSGPRGRADQLGHPQEEDHLPPQTDARRHHLRPRTDRGDAEASSPPAPAWTRFAHCLEAYSAPSTTR